MKRALTLAALLAALSPAPALAQERLSAGARIAECETALEQAGRSMEGEGRMTTIPGAKTLRMRFDLEVRTPARGKWTAVRAPNFGLWTTADPGTERYIYRKRVENLAAPARYRMIVRFRWLDGQGRRLASARRETPVCRQPDLRPDLAVKRLRVDPVDDPGRARYVLRLRNAGAAAAGPFFVALSVGDEALPRIALPAGLAAGATRRVSVVAARCSPGVPVVARVDPDAAVDERDESDNELVLPCPEG